MWKEFESEKTPTKYRKRDFSQIDCIKYKTVIL